MERTYIYSYSMKSVSSILLAAALEIRRLKHVGSKVPDGPDLTIINWGAGSVPFPRARIINPPAKVSGAANKLRFFRAMERIEGVNIPEFTTSFDTAKGWIAAGSTVCSRALLNGNSGKGLFITNSIPKLPAGSPLYTKYVPKEKEFRVHFMAGHPTRVQKKVWPKDKPKPEGLDWHIRNHEAGFIFQTAAPADIPRQVLEQATKAGVAAGLDFGAADVIWNKASQKAIVLEINTAPGLEDEGITLAVYAKGFKEMLR